ncbi:MAG: hypothetical protein ACJAVM_002427 [Sulfitobacter sp.]|jgi:hypothetical protein
MSFIYADTQFDTAKVFDLINRERACALSPREWKHRLAGYGYAIKETLQGQIVETLPHHVELGVLPAELAG